MMEKRRCARFRIFAPATLLAVVAACISVPGNTDTAPVAVPAPSPIPKIDSSIQAEVSSAETVNGTIVLVTVRLPAKKAGQPVQGNFEGIELPFFEDGGVHRAILGVPYDHPAGPATVRIRVGEGDAARGAEAMFNVVAGNYASETLKVDGRRVQPQRPRDLARIRKEVVEIVAAYDTITRKKYWKGPFALPVRKIQAVTSSFGTNRVYNGVQKSAHLGLDFKAPQGTPIYASAAGRVALSKNLFFTGNTVIVDHGYGVLTLYAHMSKLKVKKGQEVVAGQKLGLSGKTGRVTGPHLHWMAIIHKQKVNPLGLTQVMK
jgi:murein DD-endopeptidase MepM/ murein hydrolase activator NlpD